MGAKCGKASAKQVRQDKVQEDQRLAKEAEMAEMEARRLAEEKRLADGQKALEEEKERIAAQHKAQEAEAKRQLDAALALAAKETETHIKRLEEQQRDLEECNMKIKELEETVGAASDDVVSQLEAQRLHLEQERETMEIQRQRFM